MRPKVWSSSSRCKTNNNNNSNFHCFHQALDLCLDPKADLKGKRRALNSFSCLSRLESMVVNLCLPQFYTTAHCNKLCADGYDVTNLVSADPALRRRGFKLEYFLRPPVQVTLKFGFQVELCRVDVELWPWGMDQGQACKRLEISTSSDSLPSQGSSRGHKLVEQKGQMQGRDQNELNKNNKVGSKSRQSNGHQWSLQAQHWDTETVDGRQHTGHAFKNQAQTKIPTSQPESEFRLVGRCELREETKVCFSRTNYRARPPFLSPPPPQSVNCRQEELWSRGLLSLGAVTQLRVTVPFGGAASAMGLKALSVWGQPACCCPKEEVERIKRVHEASERRPTQPVFFAAPVRQTIQPQPTATPSSNLSIPEEFLDPITQEVMTLPMLLPSGVSVDSTTLEEYQKREATWGRTPNDPFTGVPFTSNSQPLPNPQLKTRIDHFLLRRGEVRRDGTLGRRGEGENPQASRLLASKFDRRPQNSSSLCLGKGSENNTSIQYNTAAGSSNQSTHLENTGLGQWLDNGNHTSNYQALPGDSKSELDRRKKRDLSGISTKELTAEKQLLPEIKRPRNDSLSVPSCSSHEQRLSASLDEALFSALQGRPSFTSNLSQQKWETPDTELLKTTQPIQSSGTPSVCKGEQTCSACSRSVSVYSTSVSSIYRLTCSHLLCHACLRRQSPRLDPATALAPSHVLCPTCRSSTARSDIIRVHH